MELSPNLYHRLVRPNWATKLYVQDVIMNNFDIENKKVLDFGCGVGSICEMFNPDNYIGIDIDQNRIRYAKYFYPDYYFYTLDNNLFEKSINSVDCILIISVLHHIPTCLLSQYLKEFKKMLNKNGKIIIIEPFFVNMHCISNYIMKYLDRGKYIRTEDEYINLFKLNGYNAEVMYRYKQLFIYNKLLFVAMPN